MRKIMLFMQDAGAATSIEYGIIAAMLACAIILAISSLGMSLAAKFAQISGNLN